MPTTYDLVVVGAGNYALTHEFDGLRRAIVEPARSAGRV